MFGHLGSFKGWIQTEACVITSYHWMLIPWQKQFCPKKLINNSVAHSVKRRGERLNKCSSNLEIDRYIGLPIFFPIFKHFTLIGYRFPKKITIWLSHTIIQSITSSEMCSRYLTHPSAHTRGAVDTVHSGEAPARPPHVTLYKIHLFESR